MNRRGFLASCLALGAAPAIVRADSLMRIVPTETGVLVTEIGSVESMRFITSSVEFEYVDITRMALSFDDIAREAQRVLHSRAIPSLALFGGAS